MTAWWTRFAGIAVLPAQKLAAELHLWFTSFVPLEKTLMAGHTVRHMHRFPHEF
jgi:hypothetical protein